MKPERLEMLGFAPFRTKAEIDFSGLELFALTGPTGAGKSSVIDAITFALYGVVARYEDKRSVSPIISLGAAEARIRFGFEVGGQSYTAVRVVRRTNKGGATTAEARLESADTVLASGAAEVTQAVETLVGLGIDHFTRSVVLPQGQFAAFLHDTPSGQQELVKALLDMGVLDDVRRLATDRAKTGATLAESAQHRLDQLADASAEAAQQAASRRDRLEERVGPVTEAEEALGRAEQEVRRSAEKLEAMRAQRALLSGLALPEGVASLAKSLEEARAAVEESAGLLASASEQVEALTEESGMIPSAERLEAADQALQRLTEARLKRDEINLDKLEAVLSESRDALDSARESRRRAEAQWEELRTRHAAHTLTVGLVKGDPCPVCAQPLPSDPEGLPPDVEGARKALERAKEAIDETSARRATAESDLVRGSASHEALSETITRLSEQVEALGDPEELGRQKKARQDVDRRLASARQELKGARERKEKARRAVGRLQASERQAWESFAASRDRVAALTPPPADREDLAAAWGGLLAWAGQAGESLDDEIAKLQASIQERAGVIASRKRALELLLGEVGVGGDGAPSARLAAAVATARADLERIEERRREAEKVEAERKRFTQESAVAKTLGTHLRADRFQGWLMAEALAALVDGANSLLDDLSQGTYSLAVSERTMEIIDHRNADERRSVRSLSGGETFLVSLALALSLGEQLTNLSGATELDAIFLDEGFGTLDAETLETVSVVVSELSARGRVVGLVTHVKELAEQVPVRFEITPGPTGSTIARVDR